MKPHFLFSRDGALLCSSLDLKPESINIVIITIELSSSKV